VTLVVATVAYARKAEGGSRAWPIAFAVAWLALFPAAAAAGLVISAPVYVEANLALEEPTLLAPRPRHDDRVHLGGADAARGSLRVEALVKARAPPRPRTTRCSRRAAGGSSTSRLRARPPRRA